MSAVGLTLVEMVILAEGADLPEQTLAKVAAIVRPSPPCEEQTAELEAMASASETRFLENAPVANRDFELLLAARWDASAEEAARADWEELPRGQGAPLPGLRGARLVYLWRYRLVKDSFGRPVGPLELRSALDAQRAGGAVVLLQVLRRDSSCRYGRPAPTVEWSRVFPPRMAAGQAIQTTMARLRPRHRSGTSWRARTDQGEES